MQHAAIRSRFGSSQAQRGPARAAPGAKSRMAAEEGECEVQVVKSETPVAIILSLPELPSADVVFLEEDRP